MRSWTNTRPQTLLAKPSGCSAGLRAMDGPSPYRISRLEHSLQTATRAENDGADEETVVCALLHDIGDELSPLNHSQVAAAVLRPYVTEKNHWIVEQHGLFQGYYWLHHYGRDRDERDRYAHHPWYEDCVAFCARWDQTSFDPDFTTAPLSHFEPMVVRLFDRRAPHSSAPHSSAPHSSEHDSAAFGF